MPLFRRPRARTLRDTALLAAALLLGACGDGGSATDPTTPLARQPVTSRLALTVNGLPSGTAATGNVTGPNGYAVAVSGSTTLTGLADGTYTLAVGTVTANGLAYTPTPDTQTVSVTGGVTASASVSYVGVPTTGALNVTVTVPNGAPAAVTITNGGGFTQTLTASTSLASLDPGSYTIAAAQITSGSIIYSPTPATQTVTITAGGTASAAVAYAATGVVPSTEFNLQILGMSLVQSVQTPDNAVPLITGRAGVLRVYAIANAANTAVPKVRVRLYQNGALVSTLTANAGGSGVPTSLNEGSATASWNVSVPGTLIQPGLSVLADVDPDNGVPEASESDNAFPVTAQPQALTVRTVPALNIRLVPITQSSTGATGNVTAANAEALLNPTRDILPVGTVTWNLREPYTTTTAMSSDGTGWGTVLGELRALRTADASKDHYYGVLKMNYNSGTAGMGYLGLPVSIGWDVGSSAGFTMAHELGHNFNRPHAPCGSVTSSDANYPYAGGVSGVFGFNVRTNTVMASSTADLMGYCSPRWISDYNYTQIMTYRGTSSSPTTVVGSGDVASAGDVAVGTTATEGLMVWGRIERNGSVVLEPAMRVMAPTQVPRRGGEYVLHATDSSGRTLYRTTFSPATLADETPDAGAHFTFVIPMSAAVQEQLAHLTVTGRGRRAERTSQQAQVERVAAATQADIASESGERARVRWNAAEYPMVVVRDAESGRILSFARGGNASIVTRKANVELTYTDGLRSASTRVRVRGR